MPISSPDTKVFQEIIKLFYRKTITDKNVCATFREWCLSSPWERRFSAFAKKLPTSQRSYEGQADVTSQIGSSSLRWSGWFQNWDREIEIAGA